MKRELTEILINRLESERAVALLGPRQAGKSYLLREVISSRGGKYISLDDPLLREEIAKDPVGYIKKNYSKGSYLFIDEAAKVPGIFDAVKIIIDENGMSPTGICLANSGNFLLMKRIKESLAGRVSLLSLYPFSWRETCNEEKTTPGIIELLSKELPSESSPASFVEIERARNERLVWGGYPVPVLSENTESKIRWASDYLKTYVFPILIEQFNIRNLEAFEKSTRLTFLQSSQTINYHRIAQETGISQPTAASYIHQLKAMMLLVILETYINNPRKRLLKQPKIHIVDSLLLHSSFGTNFSSLAAKERGVSGIIYESFIAFEIIKTLENSGTPYKMFFWRTADKAEVDLVIELGGKIIPIEIKSSEKVSAKDASGVRAFLEDNPQVQHGYIIFPGENIQEISPKVTAIPDWRMLGIA